MSSSHVCFTGERMMHDNESVEPLPPLEILLEKLENERKKFGISQEELARYIHRDQSRVSRILRRERAPTYEEMYLIVKYLHSKKKNLATTLSSLIKNKRLIKAMNDALVGEIARIMFEKGLSQVPVFDKNTNRCLGIISEISLIRLLNKHPIDELKKSKVSEFPDVIVEVPIVPETITLEEVLPMLYFSYAVLVSKNGKVVNIITRNDLLSIFI